MFLARASAYLSYSSADTVSVSRYAYSEQIIAEEDVGTTSFTLRSLTAAWCHGHDSPEQSIWFEILAPH
jgi:hypothetical protein